MTLSRYIGKLSDWMCVRGTNDFVKMSGIRRSGATHRSQRTTTWYIEALMKKVFGEIVIFGKLPAGISESLFFL